MKTTQKLKLEELGRLDVKDYKKIEKIPLVVILDNVRSMHNVGSIFRTSDAFLVEKIYLCGITPCPPHRDIQKAALGATESVDWEYQQEIATLIQTLKKENYLLVGIEQTNNSIAIENLNCKPKQKVAVILGNEVDGISDNILDKMDVFVELPQYGTKHSLNVSVCGGIVLWEMLKKLS